MSGADNCSDRTFRAGVSETDFEKMVDADPITVVSHSHAGPTSGFSRFVTFTVHEEDDRDG